MGPFVLAWLIGEGILVYRWGKNHAPPTPGALALSSGLFAGLAVLAEYEPARPLATVSAYGVDLAVLLQVLPGGNKTQQTGWPPLPVNDPSVLLPSGGKGGTIAPEGASAASQVA